jgi:Fe-S cluster biogenesis protein NfuA
MRTSENMQAGRYAAITGWGFLPELCGKIRARNPAGDRGRRESAGFRACRVLVPGTAVAERGCGRQRRRPKEHPMISKEQVQSVLDRVRPFLIADGGDIELVSVDGNSATVRLTGVCAGCPSADLTLHAGIEMALRDEIPQFELLRTA